MTTFFFHVRRGGVLYEDREGVDLPDEASARRYAAHDARTLFKTTRHQSSDMRIEVSDGERTLFSLPEESGPS